MSMWSRRPGPPATPRICEFVADAFAPVGLYLRK